MRLAPSCTSNLYITLARNAYIAQTSDGGRAARPCLQLGNTLVRTWAFARDLWQLLTYSRTHLIVFDSVGCELGLWSEAWCAVQTVTHTYDYIDFQSQIPDTVSFDPSVILPGGQGCESLALNCASDTQRKNDPASASMTGPDTDKVEIDLNEAAGQGCQEGDWVKANTAAGTLAATCALLCCISSLCAWLLVSLACVRVFECERRVFLCLPCSHSSLVLASHASAVYICVLYAR